MLRILPVKFGLSQSATWWSPRAATSCPTNSHVAQPIAQEAPDLVGGMTLGPTTAIVTGPPATNTGKDSDAQ